VTELIPFQPQHADLPETETVDITVAMAGLSVHSQRAYRRWIREYLGNVNQVPPKSINPKKLNIQMAIESFGPALLKAWLGNLKAKKLGKQSIMQAKAAVVWLAQFMADLGRVEYAVPSGLSRVKAPRAESGQRSGTWLTPDEIKQLILSMRNTKLGSPSIVARNTAIIVLMVTCGLRRDEIAGVLWSDLAKQGRNNIIRVHGKGEKLRVVKLPDMTLLALEAWRICHPLPEGERPVFTRIWKGGTVTTSGLTDRAVWIIVQQAAQRAGLPKISPHDLRRSFARGAFEAGVSFELIRQALGHSSIATTERYVNSALELDHAATDIWANTLDEE
jgi:integrase